jgi:hypothetical protein
LWKPSHSADLLKRQSCIGLQFYDFPHIITQMIHCSGHNFGGLSGIGITRLATEQVRALQRLLFSLSASIAGRQPCGLVPSDRKDIGVKVVNFRQLVSDAGQAAKDLL